MINNLKSIEVEFDELDERYEDLLKLFYESNLSFFKDLVILS